MKLSNTASQRGAIHLFFLLAAIGLIGFIVIASSGEFKNRLFGTLFPNKPQSQATGPDTASFGLYRTRNIVNVGDIFEARVHITSEVTPTNLFVAKINFDKTLAQVEGFDNNQTTIINEWVEQSYDNNAGTITLVGAVHNPGYRGPSSGDIMTYIRFRALATGNPHIIFTNDSAIHRNSDGTNILTAVSPAEADITIQNPPAASLLACSVSPGPHYTGSNITFTASGSLAENGRLDWWQKYIAIPDTHDTEFVGSISDAFSGLHTMQVRNGSTYASCNFTISPSGSATGVPTIPDCRPSRRNATTNDTITFTMTVNPGRYRSGEYYYSWSQVSGSPIFNWTPPTLNQLTLPGKFTSAGQGKVKAYVYYGGSGPGSGVAEKECDAVTVTLAGAASPTPSPSPATCNRDSDCPSGQICTSRVCVRLASPSPAASPHPGDGNGDGILNFVDLSMLYADYNKRSGFRRSSDLYPIPGDGVINAFDASILKDELRRRGIIR